MCSDDPPLPPPPSPHCTCFTDLRISSQPGPGGEARRGDCRGSQSLPPSLSFSAGFEIFHFSDQINCLALSGAHDWSILLSICVRYISSYCGANIVMKHKVGGCSLGSYNQSKITGPTFHAYTFQDLRECESECLRERTEVCMNSGLVGLGELVGPESCGVESSSMHHCVGGGPLAMVTPLHTFDSHQPHSRLPEPEESVPGQATPDSDGAPLPPGPLPPHFNDPSDQAQFEADKRQIYK